MAIVITQQPVSITARVDSTVQFTVAAEGEELTYQWEWKTNEEQQQWAISTLAGNTTPTITIDALERRNGYLYRCAITDAEGNTLYSDVAIINVLGIVANAAAALVDGNSIKVTWDATTGATKYCVYRSLTSEGGYTQIGETTELEYIDSSADLMAGTTYYYKLRPFAADGTGGSYTASVNATIPAIVITKQPQSVVASVNETVTFSVEATGVASYQWQYSPSQGTGWSNLSWSGNTTAAVSGTLSMQNIQYLYRCKLTDANGNVIYTDHAGITEPMGNITIVSQPKNVAASVGDIVSFSVVAADVSEYCWQYLAADKTIWSNLSGTDWASAKTDTLTFTTNNSRMTNLYRCRMLDSNGGVVYSEAVRIVSPDLITITKQPEAWYGMVGSTATFSVEAVGEGLTYQWEYFGGVNWVNYTGAGATTTEMTVEAKAFRNGNKYRCLITDANGNSMRTDEASLSLFLITKQPEDSSGAIGETVVLSMEATGDGLTYQWQYRPKETQTWYDSPAEGANTNTLILPVVNWRDGNQYRCVITDVHGNTLYTDVVTLTVVSSDPITITKQPVGWYGVVGATATYSVEAVGEGLTYQWEYQIYGTDNWRKSGASGNTTANLSFKTQAYQRGYKYRCLITDANGNTLSTDEVSLSLFLITKQPEDFSGAVGEITPFSVEAVGEGLKYQWEYKTLGASDWINNTLTGNATDSLAFDVRNYQDRYEYRCRITDAYGNVLRTNEVVLRVVFIEVTKQPENVLAQFGDAVVFSVAATGKGLTYQWEYLQAGTSTWRTWPDRIYPDFDVVLNSTLRLTHKYRCKLTDAGGNVVYTNEAKVVCVGFVDYVTLVGIADAIRAKTGSTAQMTPSQMIEAINQM